jgi:thioredoxin:protein disulfide reductase
MSLKKLSITFLFLFSQISFAQFGPKQDIVKIKLIGDHDKIHSGTLLKVATKLNIQEGWHINSNKPNDEFLIASKIVSSDKRFPLAKIVFPSANEINLGFSDKPVSVFENEITIGLLVNIDKSLLAGEYRIPIQFGYQACNNQSCMPPANVKDTLTISIVDEKTPVQNINNDVFKNLNLSSTVPSAKNDNENTIASTLESSGIILSLLFIFLGGLALNLTPCVYPLIPITIGYFGGQSEGRTGRLFLLGVLYVLGMALTYSVIGVVTALSGAVFGTLMQNSFVIIGIALLFIILALSQFGVYEFQLPNSWVEKAGGAKGGAYGAFFMGLTMGIVAAPCIGPFVLGLVTYVAAKGDPYYGFLMFFVLALGLGFPYLLLALFSGKIKNLPRAGVWMEGTKHIFGFLLLGMAFYFVNPILPKSVQHFILPIFGIIASLILLFVDKVANKVKGFRIFKIIFSVIVLVVSAYALMPSEKNHPDWQTFSDEKYESSLKNNEIMVIDFYADWCIPCKELDAITFSDPKVVEEMKRFSVYKVDMTQTLSEKNEKIRNKFNIVGMPTVLIVNSKGEEIERLTGFVNVEEFLQLLKKTE